MKREKDITMKNMQKDAQNLMGEVRDLQTREIKDASRRQECMLSVKSG